MSRQSLQGAAGRLRWAVPMTGRDPGDEHRSATPLELFFDLVYVVAVALAAERLHHALAGGVVGASIFRYAVLFFAIWWAWVNFTWFVSAYDTDDVAFRVFVFVTMTGALIFAAGVPRIFDELDFRMGVLGYAVMRLALVTQWIRVGRADTERRTTARRFAIGVTGCQIGWIAGVLVPGLWWPAFAVLAPAEMLVPVWAEAASPTTWNREHISERYGLFMIIVLGESVLAASLAIQSATRGTPFTGELLAIIVGGLLILFSMWWLYFDRPQEQLLSSPRTAFLWSYMHLPIFAAVAAVGAGLAVAIEGVSGHSELGPRGTTAAVAVPVAVYLLSLWALYFRAGHAPVAVFAGPATAALAVGASFAGLPVLVIGLLLVGLIVVKVGVRLRGYEGL